MINCSKETKLYTVLAIDNTKRRGPVRLRDNPDEADPIILDQIRCPGYKHYDVNDFFSDAIYTEANVMAVAKRFNLPDFSEIDLYMQKNYPGIVAHAHGQPVESNRQDLARESTGSMLKS